MTDPIYIPRPGWLALKLYQYGYDLALNLLAAGFLIAAHGDDANEWYRQVADSEDPDDLLCDFWEAEFDRSPWIVGHTGPITDWLNDCSPVRLPLIRKAADLLARVDIIGAVHQADADLLGHVYNELVAIAQRREEPMPSTSTTIAAVLPQVDEMWSKLMRGGNYADFLCSTAMRAVTTAATIRAHGGDPAKVHWYLGESDETLLALAAVNTVAGKVGPNVHLHCGELMDIDSMFAWVGTAKMDLLHLDGAELLERMTGEPVPRNGMSILSYRNGSGSAHGAVFPPELEPMVDKVLDDIEGADCNGSAC